MIRIFYRPVFKSAGEPQAVNTEGHVEPPARLRTHSQRQPHQLRRGGGVARFVSFEFYLYLLL